MVWNTLSLTIVLSYLASAHCCGSLGFTCLDGYSCHIPDLDEYCPVREPLMFLINVLQLRRSIVSVSAVEPNCLSLERSDPRDYVSRALSAHRPYFSAVHSNLLLKDDDYECCFSDDVETDYTIYYIIAIAAFFMCVSCSCFYRRRMRARRCLSPLTLSVLLSTEREGR